jgi:hypothetical protein
MATFNFNGANINNVNIYLFGGEYDELMNGEFADFGDLTEEDIKVQQLLRKCARNKGSFHKKHRKHSDVRDEEPEE